MTNHDDGDDDEDDDGNEDENDDDNVTSGSGSDGPIFDPIVTPWSHLGLTEEDRATTMTVVRSRRHMYLRIEIYLPYKYPINTIVNMCHKLWYTKMLFWTYATETRKKHLN